MNKCHNVFEKLLKMSHFNFHAKKLAPDDSELKIKNNPAML